ncbi:MAG: UDP-N-acetylmuramoyl-tripeptide--D-alanyl-D-alanine ligase [Acidobacteria bacterium]|nr:UDP-N-acetylmuramoyl-tripeptide--D-alanyl-D-alanine ligase [Acidobacteriota bacterium]
MQLAEGTYSASDLAAAVGGRQVSGAPTRRLGRVSIDSRSLAPGDLFFAIVAARDGHDFVPAAVARGAAGVVVQRATGMPAGAEAVVVEVPDTLQALQSLGRAVRRASAARVVAITGSAGKTTTKDAIAAVVGTKYRVVKNRGNLNNHLGLPISLVELRACPEVAVMELGMNHAGEIRVLVGLAEPDIRVWTNVGDAHIGYFGSREAIADAKAEILEQASASTVFVGNADDPLVMARAATFGGRTVTFGVSAGADVRAVDIDDRGIAGTSATVRTPAGEMMLTIALPGRGHLLNALAATAVGLELGIDTATIARELAALVPTEHRGVSLTTPSGATILDDSYNSSPAALLRALDVLGASHPAGRRVAVLGEMLELGDQAITLHEACGRHAAAAGVERLVTVGGEPARRLGEAAVAAGLGSGQVRHAATSDEAATLVSRELGAGDLVLVKGSRGIKTDTVVARLMAGGA